MEFIFFVHGCLWHRHENCKYASNPKTRKEFWENKFKANVKRDKNNFKELKNLNWKVLVIWECELNYLQEIITQNINI